MANVYDLNRPEGKPGPPRPDHTNVIFWSLATVVGVLLVVTGVLTVSFLSPGSATTRTLATESAPGTAAAIPAAQPAVARNAAPGGSTAGAPSPPAGLASVGAPLRSGVPGAPITGAAPPTASPAPAFPSAAPAMPGAPATLVGQPYPPIQPAAPVQATQPSAQDIIARAKNSVVLVLVETPNSISSGSGFLVSATQVATCYHVVDNALRIVVISADGQRSDATRGAFDQANDVAILHCRAGLGPPLTLANSDQFRDGDEIAVTGFPAFFAFLEVGYRPAASTSRGSISARRSRVTGLGRIEELQTDAAINPGNSGGPAYSTRDGSVVGVAAAKLQNNSGIGFLSTSNAVRRLLGR